MYLLTYEFDGIYGDGTTYQPKADLLSEERAFGLWDHATAPDTKGFRNPELFERRGNDWIRIRPEGE